MKQNKKSTNYKDNATINILINYSRPQKCTSYCNVFGTVTVSLSVATYDLDVSSSLSTAI
jgi:hypothetical protein